MQVFTLRASSWRNLRSTVVLEGPGCGNGQTAASMAFRRIRGNDSCMWLAGVRGGSGCWTERRSRWSIRSAVQASRPGNSTYSTTWRGLQGQPVRLRSRRRQTNPEVRVAGDSPALGLVTRVRPACATRWCASGARPCSGPGSSWCGCLPRPSPLRRAPGRCRCSSRTNPE